MTPLNSPKKTEDAAAFNDMQRMMRLSIAFTGARFSAWQGGRGVQVWSGGVARRASGGGRLDLLWWFRWEGRRTPRAPGPGPAERPSGRGKHMQGTWPDLDTNPDSHNHTHMLTHTHKLAHTHTGDTRTHIWHMQATPLTRV